AVSLIDQNDGTFALNHTFAVAATAQRTDIDILVLQTTAIGEHWIRMRRHIEVSDMPTAVLESHDPTLPAEFALSQNHPNPFNPETMIHFDLPTPGETELSLFNLMGQRVATLVSGSRDAGSYMLRWDGRDDTGRELASGVYLFRLIAGDQIETRKLTLLR
ncbi:MAG: T9SS type A sorting domain-containing protein, partial [Gemmatimonadetes bacterium]|nr:T9SS type A sorting domain-containing protein [Gemmatimonadota bacterium]